MLFFIVSCIALWAVLKLKKTLKQRNLAYSVCTNDHRELQHNPEYLLAADGTRQSTWCPNCGKNL